MLKLRMLTRVLSLHFSILSCLALALAVGARQQTETLRTIVDGVDLDVPLATFFLDVQAPHISIQEDRHGLPQNRTRVLVEISRSHVPAHMPVITSSLQPGLVHSVVHTWDWLQVGSLPLTPTSEMFELTHWSGSTVRTQQHVWKWQCCNCAAAAQSLFDYHSNMPAVILYICRNTQSCMPGSNSVSALEHRCGTQSQASPLWLHQPCTPQQMCQAPSAQSLLARRNNASAGCTNQQPVPS